MECLITREVLEVFEVEDVIKLSSIKYFNAYISEFPEVKMYQSNGQFIINCWPTCYRPTEKHCEIIVKNLPRQHLKIKELIDIFVIIGCTLKIRLMMDFSGSNRGYCFVKYLKPHFAQEALKNINGYEIRLGVKLNAELSLEKSRLYVANIPTKLQNNDIIKAFSELEGFKQLCVHNRPNTEFPMLSRVFGYVDFFDHHNASVARKIIPSIMYKEWGVINPMVNWSEPDTKVSEAVMATVTTVFVRGLSKEITEDHIKYLINHVRNIRYIKHYGHFAFIFTKSRNAAENIISQLDGIIINGSFIEATFARPRKDIQESTNDINILC